MATWILFFQLLFPTAPTAVTAEAPTAEADEGMRYRGIEAMFARFEAEAAEAG